MGFIERELQKLLETMSVSADEPMHLAVLAARQALFWATDPTAYMSPTEFINRDTPEGSEDCLGHSHPPQSLETGHLAPAP
jgi:hypothetical protein